MNKIIALKGRGGSGKTTTIRILYPLLLKIGYIVVYSNFNPVTKDNYVAVLQKDGILLGITSSGDTHDIVHDQLDFLINTHKCPICICACHTYDRIPPGTIAAVQSFAGYNVEFIQKTYASSPSAEITDNTRDALTLLGKI